MRTREELLLIGERLEDLRSRKTNRIVDDFAAVYEAWGTLSARDELIAADRDALRAENEALTTALRDVVKAMEQWGSWEDGVPSADAGSGCGEVGAAYDRAKALLDAKEGG
jgi:hypothetical protein